MFEMRLAKLNNNSVISIARDITKRKTAEFQLEEAKNRAEAADSLKSAFLANLSHEIRTPMNAIMGSAEILSESELPDEEREEYSTAIIGSGYQLMKMIDDTINLSKIETKTIEVEKSFVRINSLMRELFTLYEPIINAKKEVDFELLTDIKSTSFGFITDRGLLSEALSKMIDNAIKFTDSGIVTFGYRMASTSSIEFFVEDTGKGIPVDELDNIYGRFYKVDKSNTLQNSGSGVGLAIAKEFVSLLGGSLDCESTLHEGSRFFFTLKFEQGEGYMKVLH
jgi:signal transduction histidine kinase